MSVALAAPRVASHDVIDAGAKFNLPPLPSRDVLLHASVNDRATKSSLKTLAAAIKATAG